MHEVNTLIIEELDQLNLMVLAPGANRNNTRVQVDNGSSKNEPSVVYIKVDNPELPEKLKDQAELNVNVSRKIDSKYDTSTLKVGVRDGIVFVRVSTAKDRVQEITIDE
jgi:hypothetical protein